MVNWGDTRTIRERQAAERIGMERDKQRLRDASGRGTNPEANKGPNVIDDDPNDDPGTGTSAAANLMGKSAGAGRTDGSETTVSPIAECKLRPYHDTQDVILPYSYTSSVALTASTASAGQGSFAIRLNSIYDVQIASTFTDNPVAGADSVSGTAEKVMMFDYWSTIYNYWTVTESHYKVTFWTETVDRSYQASIWCYHNGGQQPPLLDAQGTPQIIPDWTRKTHKHCHMKHLRPNSSSTTDKHSLDTAVVFSGRYRPGNYTVVNDVSEDEYKETWHKSNEVPSMREVATFIANVSDETVGNPIAITIKYKVDIVYKVQWKDLKRMFQYPVKTDDFASVTDSWNMN